MADPGRLRLKYTSASRARFETVAALAGGKAYLPGLRNVPPWSSIDRKTDSRATPLEGVLRVWSAALLHREQGCGRPECDREKYGSPEDYRLCQKPSSRSHWVLLVDPLELRWDYESKPTEFSRTVPTTWTLLGRERRGSTRVRLQGHWPR